MLFSIFAAVWYSKMWRHRNGTWDLPSQYQPQAAAIPIKGQSGSTKGQLGLRLGQLTVSPSQLNVSSGQLKVSQDLLQVSEGQLKFSLC